MVSVLNQKLVRDLKSARWMLVAIVMIMAVGVLTFISMRAVYFDLRNAQEEYYQQSQMADFWIDLKKMPLTALDQLYGIPGISKVRPRIQSYITVDLPDAKLPLNGLVLSMPDVRQPVINDIVLRRGSYFTGSQPNEVIVNAAFAEAHQLGPGDSIHLLINNRRQQLRIVGTAISSEMIYTVGPGEITPSPGRYGVFYLSHDFAEEIFDMQGAANQVVGLLSPQTAEDVQQILDEAEYRLSEFGVMATTPRKDQMSNTFISAEIDGLRVFSTILPVIFLAAAALVLNILISRLVDQQRTIIGTLKAIGYSDIAIFWHYIQFGLILGIGSGLLGCFLGYWLAHGLTVIYQDFFEFPSLQTRVYPGIYFAGVLISTVCALAGSIHGAWQSVRLMPAQAMRPKPPVSGRRIWIERAGFIWGLLNFTGRMVVRNIFRNRLRTGVGMFAAAMGTCLLIVSFTSLEAFNFLIDFQFYKIDRSDIELSFESERGRSALYEASRLTGVDHAEPVLTVPCHFRNGHVQRQGGITGLIPNARLTIPRDRQGRPVRIPTSGLLMTDKIAELLHVSVGDKLIIEPTIGQRKPMEVPVVEISESFLGSNVYADLRYLSRLMDEEFAMTGVQLSVNPEPRIKEQLYRELKSLPSIQGVRVRSETIQSLEETLVQSQYTSILVLVAFAGILFFGSVLNASLVSLAERQREIATLRVLGYSEGEIGWMVFLESMAVNLCGTLLGLPLGYQLYVLVVEMNDLEFLQLPLISPPEIWLISVLLSIGFACSAHLVVQRRIHRMDWHSALRVQE